MAPKDAKTPQPREFIFIPDGTNLPNAKQTLATSLLKATDSGHKTFSYTNYGPKDFEASGGKFAELFAQLEQALVENKWGNHKWDFDTWIFLNIRDPRVICFQPTEPQYPVVQIQVALLQFYCRDSEWPSQLVTGYDRRTLHAIKEWHDSGKFSNHAHELPLWLNTLFSVYEFAFHHNNLAMRRDVFNAMVKVTHPPDHRPIGASDGLHRQSPFSFFLPTRELLNRLYAYEGPLPLYAWWDHYINSHMPWALPGGRCIVDQVSEHGYWSDVRFPCQCTHRICDYHEHGDNGGAEEQEATCGLGAGLEENL